LPLEGCVPYNLQPTAAVTTLDNVTSYLWDFGDGNTSTSSTPSNVYSAQGTYNVSLTITTSTGCTETLLMNNAVRVGTKPVTKFTATPNPVCALQPVQFTNQTSPSDQWVWDFGDGSTSVEANPLYTYSDTGRFDVTLVAKNNGCPDTLKMVKYIGVNPPIAKFGFNANCNNKLEMIFTDSSIGATTWFWDFGDGDTSNARNPTHVYSSFKNYTVTLTVTNDTCSNTISKNINVFDVNPDFIASDTNFCRRKTVYFNATVGNANNIVNYLWDFGDGTQWNSDNFDKRGASYHFYGVSGTYTVTLTTTDIYGCKKVVTKPKYIRVNGATASFSAVNVDGCAGLTTTFNDLSKNDGVNPIINWQWNFGDGADLAYTQGPFVHTYNAEGTYSVSLKTYDAAGCVDSFSINNLVHTTRPIADFKADTLSCPGSNIAFANNSTAVTYTSEWIFGDGATDNLQAPTHAYADTGIYSVTLRILDKYGCADTITKPAYIKVARPYASFTLSDSISSCSPFEVHFTNTSEYYSSFRWDLGGGTSTRKDPVQYYINPGVYNIQLAVVSPGGCTDTAYNTVTVYDTVGTFIRYTPLAGCKPLSVDLNTYSKGPASYTWDFGDGVLLNNTVDTINHIYRAFGDFVPKIIMTDPSGCIIPVTGADTIRIIGTAAKFGVDKQLLCDSGYVAITDSTTFNDALIRYEWNFGDGSGSTSLTPGGHYYTTPGLYTLSLNVETQQGCVDTFLHKFVKVVPSPLISIVGDSVICLNDFLEHQGVFNRQDTAAVSWLWNFPNGNTSDVQFPVLQQYTTAGNFTVAAMATNSSGCKDTAYQNILVHPLPQVTMPSTLIKQVGFPIIIPATYSSNVVSYNWVPASSLSCADCPQPETNSKFDETYIVTFVDSNTCRNSGQIKVIVVCKNANVFLPNTFSPNADGSNDIFYVRGRGLERVKSLRIFNRWGEVVFESSNFPVNDSKYGWDGMYKGKRASPDVYVYQVEVFCENSDTIKFEGNVALIQ
jgi:gliding motility-associated-like protein